ncbi:hypothetical protein HDE_02103 [Halotydeus destructor]|nr:hypothetical protein HDE_02103 [Halotydeus destructor]
MKRPLAPILPLCIEFHLPEIRGHSISKMAEPKGFSLHVLRESLIKCRGDSAASRGRIKRLKQEITDVNDRITEQEKQNAASSTEVNKMRQNKVDLIQEIAEKSTILDQIYASNTNFVKDAILIPADNGIEASRNMVVALEDMKEAAYKLQVMLRRENPEKEDKGTNIDLPYLPRDDGHRDLEDDVLSAQIELFDLQQQLREVKDIARGQRPKPNSLFVSMTRSEWEARLEKKQRLQTEIAETLSKISEIENAVRAEEEARKQAELAAAGDVQAGQSGALESVMAQMDTDDVSPTNSRVVVQQVEQLDEIGNGDRSNEVAMVEDDDDGPAYVPYYTSYNPE